MSVLDQLAVSLNIRSDAPNQELACRLVENKDREGIKELADNVNNQNANIASDCIKTLYEIGYLDPTLIEDHVLVFVKAIHSRNNRLVWGGMIALGLIAEQKAEEIFKQVEFIKGIFESGSVITIDHVVVVLAKVASTKAEYEKEIFPTLLLHLKSCRIKEVPQHAEKAIYAVNSKNRESFIRVLEGRLVEMNPSQVSRIKKVIHDALKKP